MAMAWERLAYTMGKAGEECGCCLGRVWERPKIRGTYPELVEGSV